MGKFRSKPVEIEAVQFTGENWAEMHEFTGHRNVDTEENPHWVDVFNPIGTFILAEHGTQAAELWVEANKTVLPLVVGEWVIEDKLGFYPCDPEVFSEKYEALDDTPAEVKYPEPTAPGFYKYSGGRQLMVFLLDETHDWNVIMTNGMSTPCSWEYIEQALSVWDLVKI